MEKGGGSDSGAAGTRDEEQPGVDEVSSHAHGTWFPPFRATSGHHSGHPSALSLLRLHEAALSLTCPVRPAWPPSPRRHT